eukprot:Tamp_11071.p1 GENE.Tamp_11071~~Tamp_11071.p1  ORF type:complete len:491 (-),score=134.38 Tamp_11071:488-1783(-)
MRAKGLAFWLADEHKIDMSKVELRQSPLEGLGVFAAQDLPAGEPLFDIPQSCCIYPELVFTDRQLGKSMTALASKAGAGGIDTVALATYLAREKMMGAESRFRPFIEVCPWDSLHPLLWTEAEQDLLDFSYAYVQLNEILDQVDVATDIIEPVLNPKGWKQLFQAIETENMDSDAFSFMMRGAFASVLSRNFDSNIGGSSSSSSSEQREPRVIIPLLDIFNHDPKAATISFDAVTGFEQQEDGKRSFQVRVAAGGAVGQGIELFNYYGTKPNWDMLTTYGFVSSNPACQESTLTTSLDTSDALFGQKKDALGKLGVKASGQIWDVAHGQEPSKLLLPYFRIAAMDDVQQLQRADAALQGEISEDNERRAKEGLAATIATRRKDLREARSRAQQARDAGKDVFVRAQVAELVGELLDSEEAALDDFTTRMKL